MSRGGTQRGKERQAANDGAGMEVIWKNAMNSGDKRLLAL
jgi:hypothetical protein